MWQPTGAKVRPADPAERIREDAGHAHARRRLCSRTAKRLAAGGETAVVRPQAQPREQTLFFRKHTVNCTSETVPPRLIGGMQPREKGAAVAHAHQ
jgi:hypothetical protein